jgi:hypothetical protein
MHVFSTENTEGNAKDTEINMSKTYPGRPCARIHASKSLDQGKYQMSQMSYLAYLAQKRLLFPRKKEPFGLEYHEGSTGGCGRFLPRVKGIGHIFLDRFLCIIVVIAEGFGTLIGRYSTRPVAFTVVSVAHFDI